MDVSFFNVLNPLDQTLIGTFFAWSVTALGASAVFFTHSVNRKLFDVLLGFAAGIMLAASFFSLLHPSIIISEILPQEKEFYESCADDANLSRFSGGLHLMQDCEEGIKVGKMIGNKVLQDMKEIPHTFIFDGNDKNNNL